MAHEEFSWRPEKTYINKQGYADSLKQIGVNIDDPALSSKRLLTLDDPYNPTKLDKIAMKEVGTGYQPPMNKQELNRRIIAYREGKTFAQ